MRVLQTNLNRSNLFSLFKMDSLKIGDSLVFDILIKRDKNYVIIIEAGTVLTSKLYKKLQKQDKLYMTKEDEAKKTLTCESLESYTKYNIGDLEKSLHFLYRVNEKLFTDYLNSDENQISIECIESIVKSIVFLTQNDKDFLKSIIPYFKNEYELSIHSLHVSIYAISLGTTLKLDSNELLQLGVASLLHDTGMKKIDDSITFKKDKLSLAEYEKVYHHPEYSAEIAKHNHIKDPYIIDAITHHHENYDGSGYPHCLNFKKISNLASIISISDVFDAMTNARPQRDAYSSFDALKLMMKDDSMASKFNYKYLQEFLKII